MDPKKLYLRTVAWYVRDGEHPDRWLTAAGNRREAHVTTFDLRDLDKVNSEYELVSEAEMSAYTTLPHPWERNATWD
jgi:hypothetical protein